MDNNESLAKAAKELMFKEPFYGLFLIMLNKQWHPGLGTAGVSKNGLNFQLSIDPEFWGSLTEEWKQGILKHELLHIAFFHLTMRKSYPDHKLWNIAADIEINQYIDGDNLPCTDMTREEFNEVYNPVSEGITKDYEDGKITRDEAKKLFMTEIPPRGQYLQDFPELEMKEKAGTDYYYKKLVEAQQAGDCQGLKACLASMGGGMDPEPGQGNPSDHPTWNEFDNLSEAEQKMIQKQADHILSEIANQVQKSRGTIPSELRAYLEGLSHEEPPKFDWRGYLRMFTGGSIKTYTKKTRRKLSRRFYGQPGLRIKQKKHILVGVDTSGSVNNDELAEFFHEIYHMHKTGADVTVIQCDAAISHVGPFKKGDNDKIVIHGRGGTDFQPVVDYYNEHQRNFSCLVYLTDGEAPAPEPRPKGRCLWVLSSVSNMNEDLPGTVIKLN